MEDELKAQGDPRMAGKGRIFDEYAPTSGDGFYEKFMRGENVNAGWVNKTDFEKAPTDSAMKHCILLFLAALNSALAARTAQHRLHPRRRPGLLRPRLLRRRDRDAAISTRWRRTACASRSSTTRPAAGRRAARCSPATTRSRFIATRCRMLGGGGQGVRPAVGAAAAGLPQAGRLSQLPQRQVAHRRQGARRRLRPLARHEEPGQLLHRRRATRSTTCP